MTKLRAENTSKANAAIEFVKSNGVDSKDIQVAGYNVEPRYQYFNCSDVRPLGDAKPCPPPEIVGYTIAQTVSVKARDFAKAGDILSGVVDRGANQVSQISFTVDDPSKLEDQAREQAVAKAKEKAASVARAGGFGMGRLLSIQENGTPPFYYDAYGKGGSERSLAAPAASSVAPVIEPGSQEIKVTVSLTYEIK